MQQRRYKVFISPKARKDIGKLYNFIACERFQRETAERYVCGIHNTIDKLVWLGNKIGISLNENLQEKYGYGVRTIIYKNVTIIYNIKGGRVFVRRVKSSGSIK